MPMLPDRRRAAPPLLQRIFALFLLAGPASERPQTHVEKAVTLANLS